MRKVIWSILVTLDGFIDHTAMIADEETHQDATAELNAVEMVLFGRVMYQLFVDFWPSAETDSSLTQGKIAFARKINRIPKIVFSNTLEKVEWKNARLVKEDAVEYVAKLKQQSGGDLLIAGSALANSLMQHDLIDEYRLSVNPIVLGNGKRLFRNGIKKNLKLVDINKLNSGVVVLRYQPESKEQ